MKDPRTSRTRSNIAPPPSIEELRAAIAARVSGRHRPNYTPAHLIAHIDLLAAGRESVSPAAARMEHRDRPTARRSILPVLPD